MTRVIATAICAICLVFPAAQSAAQQFFFGGSSYVVDELIVPPYETQADADVRFIDGGISFSVGKMFDTSTTTYEAGSFAYMALTVQDSATLTIDGGYMGDVFVTEDATVEVMDGYVEYIDIAGGPLDSPVATFVGGFVVIVDSTADNAEVTIDAGGWVEIVAVEGGSLSILEGGRVRHVAVVDGSATLLAGDTLNLYLDNASIYLNTPIGNLTLMGGTIEIIGQGFKVDNVWHINPNLSAPATQIQVFYDETTYHTITLDRDPLDPGVVTLVPEPGAIAMLAAGLPLLIALHQRKKRSSD